MEGYEKDPSHGDIRWMAKIQSTELKTLCIYVSI